MCWPISSCALWSPGRTGSGVRRGQEGMVKTSGSMFSWLLRDPQSLRLELYMFSQVDISVVPQWRGKRDFNVLLRVLFSVQCFFFQGTILMDSSLERDLHSCMQHERQANWKKTKKPTQTHSDVRQLAMACHTPLRMCRSQSSDSIHQARQKERERQRGREEWRSKQRLRGERERCKTTAAGLSARERQRV